LSTLLKKLRKKVEGEFVEIEKGGAYETDRMGSGRDTEDA
jgi:hypothetical protein